MTDLLMTAEGIDVRGLRREEYERLADLGVFEGERVELIGGEIVRMSPQHEPHSWAIMRLTSIFAPLMVEGYEVRVQLPLAADDVSLPEPDVAITDHQISRHDRPTTALVVIEVALTSQRMDLVFKPPRYASAGVPVYVVLDLAAGQAVVHRDPAGSRYTSVTWHSAGDDLDLLGITLPLTELLTD
ncbi:MAG: Uma2 family endonuclease [Euzebya sp.]